MMHKGYTHFMISNENTCQNGVELTDGTPASSLEIGDYLYITEVYPNQEIEYLGMSTICSKIGTIENILVALDEYSNVITIAEHEFERYQVRRA